MAEQTYTYRLDVDFPNGINPYKLLTEIRNSAISKSCKSVDTNDNDVLITFNAKLTQADRTILDGTVAGSSSSSSSGDPAEGLIAAHDYTPDAVPATPVEVSKIPEVRVAAVPANVGDRAWLFSLDFCDKTTWYPESIHTSQEFVAEQGQTAFQLAHEFVIDLTHGKISDEDKILNEDGDPYTPIVKVNGVVKTEQPFAEEGGDYVIDYETGTVVFLEDLNEDDEVEVDYWYSPPDSGSTMVHTPPAGKKLALIQVEAQFSKDIVMTSEINVGVFFRHPIAGPILVESSFARYKRTRDLHNWARGAFPMIPAFGGSPRGNSQDVIVMRFDYLSPIMLPSSQNLDIRFWLKQHIPFTGEFATFTFYGVYENE